MQLQEKAHYNLLRLKWLHDQSLDVKPWQIEDYRILEDAELFRRLSNMGISLDRNQFLIFADECETPEELTELLRIDETNLEERDHVYLLLFELWRRYLPEKQSITLFCDELDHQITLYDQGVVDIERMQEILNELEDILDQHVDAGEEPKTIFSTLSACCAHDLDRFLYDFILDNMDNGDETYASELIDGFYEYLEETKGFDFLRLHLFAEVDPIETARLLNQLLERLQEEPDFELLIEVGYFLVSFGEDSLFRPTILEALKQMENEEDFQEVLALVHNYYNCLDQEEKEKQIDTLLQSRSERDLNAPIDPQDSAIELLKHHLPE